MGTRIHKSLSRIEEFTEGRYSHPTVPSVAGTSNVSGTEDIGVLCWQGLAHKVKFSSNWGLKMEFFRRLIGSVHPW